MTWLRLDDGFSRHPRMIAAGLHGRALFIAGLCYCGTHLTDGMIPKAAVPMLCAEAGVPAKTSKTLIEVGSWVDKGDHIEVHDFLVYNPSRSKVLGEREASRSRQKKWRDSHVTDVVSNGVTNGVSSHVPSRPVPSPSLSSSSSLSSVEDDLPDELWKMVAKRKLTTQSGVRNPVAWLARAETNACFELSDRASELLSEYDVTVSQLADALVAGQVPPQWNACRRIN